MARDRVLGDVERRNVRRRILTDLYSFLMQRSWRHLIALAATVYLSANVVFAALYDLGGACISGASSFRDLFFFSVQTLSTIGYGTMAPQTTYAHSLVAVEAFSGTIFLAVTTGLMFAKFSRPTARVMWSNNAVLIERGGRRLLMFRLANERGNQIVEAQLRVAVARNEVMPDGERMRRFYDIALQRDRNVLFVLSWTAIHEIDEKSPLYGLTIDEMKRQGLQLVCSVMGIDETVSAQVHARNSYTPDTFVENRRFADIIGQRPDGSRYVDYARFHELVPMGTVTPEAP